MTQKKHELFCSPVMNELFDKSHRIKYEKDTELAVLTIARGSVHPLELSETGENENKQFGGVCDSDLKFVPLSLQRRFCADSVTPITDWYTGSNPELKDENIKYIDEDVVFLGPVKRHFAHFYLETLSRAWFFLDEANLKYKVAYLTQGGDNPDIELMKEAFALLGLDMENFIEITEPTRFRNVIIPEQSYELNRCYHQKYKETIERLKSSIVAEKHEKVYFSKKFNYVGSNRTIGDEMAEELFSKNEYEVFYPEKMSLSETLSILKGCDEFAACSGSNAHNALFLEDGVKVVVLNRSEHVHPTQTMIDEMRGLNSTYIDSYCPILPVDWSIGPFTFCYTEHLEDYLQKNEMSFCKGKMIGESTRNLPIFLKSWAQFYASSGFSNNLPTEKIDARILIKQINQLPIGVPKP